MKHVVLLFFLVTSFLSWSFCPSTNLYDQLDDFSENLRARDQSYGTCYAEANSYIYNYMHNKNNKSLHPLYFMVFTSVRDTLSVNGGIAGKFSYIDEQRKFCPYSSIKIAIDEYAALIKQLTGIPLSYNFAEKDFLAILQTLTIFRHVNFELTDEYIQNYILQLNDKENVYLNLSEYIVTQNKIQNNKIEIQSKQTSKVDFDVIHNSKYNISRDNMQVVPNLPLNEDLRKSIVHRNLFKIINIHYKLEKPIFVNSEKRHVYVDSLEKFLYKITNAIYKYKTTDFKKVLYNFLNYSCDEKDKIPVDEKIITGPVFEFNLDRSKNALDHMTTYLEYGSPIRLNINSLALSYILKGNHAAVMMGSRLASAGSCEVLIRDSRGIAYNDTNSCYCYNSLNSQYGPCKLDEIISTPNTRLLACWYPWQKIEKYLYSFQPAEYRP